MQLMSDLIRNKTTMLLRNTKDDRPFCRSSQNLEVKLSKLYGDKVNFDKGKGRTEDLIFSKEE